MNEHEKARSRGRYGERRLAKKVGGVIVGRSKAVKLLTGEWMQINCQRPPDVVTALFSFESKWLKTAPKGVSKIVGQAVKNAPAGLIPVAVIGDRSCKEVFYIMTEQDFLALHVGRSSS